jgi:pyruvate dehydrogenase E1 component alpha subunit
MHLADFSVGSLGESGIVGAAMPAATGAALSARLRGTDQICLCFFGDGASNSGLFHESLNLAAVWKLPVIFLCENNGYALCTPQAQTTSVQDIAVRAGSYGIPGIIVDGQDAVAVYESVSVAASRARLGGGPTLIEAKTYRFCEHLEGNQFPVYRPADEVRSWKERDPIDLLSARLQNEGTLSDEELSAIRADVEDETEAALRFAEQSPVPENESLFANVFGVR